MLRPCSEHVWPSCCRPTLSRRRLCLWVFKRPSAALDVPADRRGCSNLRRSLQLLAQLQDLGSQRHHVLEVGGLQLNLTWPAACPCLLLNDWRWTGRIAGTQLRSRAQRQHQASPRDRAILVLTVSAATAYSASASMWEKLGQCRSWGNAQLHYTLVGCRSACPCLLPANLILPLLAQALATFGHHLPALGMKAGMHRA
jgi:hypothetical protein